MIIKSQEIGLRIVIFFKSEKYMCVIETCHSIHVIVLTGMIKPGLSQAVKNSRDIKLNEYLYNTNIMVVPY